MTTKKRATGLTAVCDAWQLVDIDVTASYPIRPYTAVFADLAKRIANGQMKCEMVLALGEHHLALHLPIGDPLGEIGEHGRVGPDGVGRGDIDVHKLPGVADSCEAGSPFLGRHACLLVGEVELRHAPDSLDGTHAAADAAAFAVLEVEADPLRLVKVDRGVRAHEPAHLA